jgi:hypothetical protein
MEQDTVIIVLQPAERMTLDQQINDRMEQLGHGRYDYRALGVGIDLPANWPGDVDCEINLAQLVVLATVLKMQIIIGGVQMAPRKDAPAEQDGHASG